MAKKKQGKGVSLAQFAALTTFSDLMSLLLTLFVLLYALSEPKRPKLEATLSVIRQRMQRLPFTPPPKPAIRPQRTTQAELGILRRGPPGKRSEVTTLSEDDRQKIVIGGEGLFLPGSAVLTAKAKRILQRDVAPDLAGFRNRVEIAGHAATADGESPDLVWTLAGERALATMRFLVDVCGVDERRFRLINGGGNEPLDPADPSRNRRVEVIMTEVLVGDPAAN
ncbi:MAG: OmpA family protein [Planctomycetota bacterium]|jgi:chemotaxis protein MotB|nr:OmpA family protein [Planctomycetota bacterium]